MSNIFTKVEHTKLGSNTFNLSHERKFSLQFGELIPILVMPTIPGDQVKLSVSQMLRFAPMIAPVMHRVNVYTHYFFVPHRITWKHWEKFLTSPEADDVLPPEPVEIPKLYIANDFTGTQDFQVTVGSLADYMGLPLTDNYANEDKTLVSLLPFMAYQRVYKDYYRDQNLEPPVDTNTYRYYFNSSLWPLDLSGLLPDDSDTALIKNFLTTKRKRAWQHDYFTSALPFSQKGDPVMIPLGTTAPLTFQPNGDPSINRDPVTGAPTSTPLPTGGDAAGEYGFIDAGVPSFTPAALDVSGQHIVDLESAVAASVTDLRTAFSLEKFLERNARSGSRYFEWIKAHLGVHVSDGLVNRPEYLGGGANPVVISEVLQTSAADSEPTPQGNMAGHGISAGRGASFNYYCKEHGYIIGVMSVMPKTAYQQGIPREFTKFDQFDFFTPEFQNIGEQPIYNKEIYAQGTSADDEVWGYIPRYSEYKYIPSTVHGEMKTTLDFWHMGRKFDFLPTLNHNFIQMNANEVSRVFAVELPETEQLYCYLNHSIKARRKMQYFGSPGITRM